MGVSDTRALTGGNVARCTLRVIVSVATGAHRTTSSRSLGVSGTTRLPSLVGPSAKQVQVRSPPQTKTRACTRLSTLSTRFPSPQYQCTLKRSPSLVAQSPRHTAVTTCGSRRMNMNGIQSKRAKPAHGSRERKRHKNHSVELAQMPQRSGSDAAACDEARIGQSVITLKRQRSLRRRAFGNHGNRTIITILNPCRPVA